MVRNKTEKSSSIRNFVRPMLVFAVFVFVLTPFYGCKKEPGPVPAKKAAPPPAVQVEPVKQPENKSGESQYEYNRGGRRDPFRPLIEVAKPVEEEGVRATGTLESYDISDFTVVAIARKGDRFFALLQSSDNKAFTVYKGTILGLRKGKVEEITRNEVITVEEFQDTFGKTRSRQIILELHKGEE